jgi:hypothetical protein
MNKDDIGGARFLTPETRVDLGATGAGLTGSPSPFILDAIPDTDATGGPSPVASGAAGTAPHGARRLHVDDVGPVAGRSEADDQRVCLHESSHAVIGRHWSELGGVTCQPGDGYSGLCWGPAYDRHAKFAETDDAPSLCEKIGPLMPAIGESRSSVADIYLHCFNRIIELVAGTEAERLFLPGEPWFAHDDERQSIALALMITSSPASADAMIFACRVECAALLEASAHIVRALAAELQAERTMDGAAIDSCIARAVAAKDAADECQRRVNWKRIELSAAHFSSQVAGPYAR